MRLLLAAFCLLFAATTLLGLAIPIKDDEVFYKLLNGRFFNDDGSIISLFPLCKESFSVESPALWFIPRIIDGLVNYSIQNLLYIRVLGVVSHIAFLGLLIWFSYVFLGMRQKAFLAAIVAVLSLDVMPFILEINRPEQNIIITILLLLIMAFSVHAGKITGRIHIIITCIFFWLSANYLFYSHPKTLMLLPFVLVLAYLVAGGKKNIIVFGSVGLMTLCSAYVAINTHMARVVCDSYPSVKALFGALYLSVEYLLRDPLNFILQAGLNLLLMFQYMVSPWWITRNSNAPLWLPVQLRPVDGFYTLFDDLLSQGVAAFYCIMAWIIFSQAYKAARHFWYEKTVTPEKLVGLSLLFSLLLIAALQTQKMFYESAMFIPLAVISYLLLAPKELYKSEQTRRYILIIIGIATVSQINLIYKYSPYALSLSPRQQDRIWAMNEDLDLLVMAGSGDFKRTKSHVIEAANKCNITTDSSSRHVVIDTLTYHYFQRTYKPLSFIYLSSIWYLDGDKEFSGLFTLMHDMQSSGMVTLCATTPAAIRRHMIETGEFCCLKGVQRQTVQSEQ